MSDSFPSYDAEVLDVLRSIERTLTTMSVAWLEDRDQRVNQRERIDSALRQVFDAWRKVTGV